MQAGRGFGEEFTANAPRGRERQYHRLAETRSSTFRLPRENSNPALVIAAFVEVEAKSALTTYGHAQGVRSRRFLSSSGQKLGSDKLDQASDFVVENRGKGMGAENWIPARRAKGAASRYS